ncbi:MAG TPA: hypothetical protein VN380_17140 [Thermoanaerobaculia bacterium]|nr:hypothetical protein [Thermoanaerobaculia bacterium]
MLEPTVVWSLSLVLIAAVYIGFAVADGRRLVLVVEVAVESAFVIVAAAAMRSAPWPVVIGLVAHGLKDTWQERTHFVANPRWWPPFCLVALPRRCADRGQDLQGCGLIPSRTAATTLWITKKSARCTAVRGANHWSARYVAKRSIVEP